MAFIRTEFDGGVLEIVLDRPDALNALNSEMREELLQSGIRAVKPNVRSILLRGNGRAFSAGMDLREAGDERLSGQTLRRHLAPFILMLQSTNRPIVAVLDGLVVGAGVGIGLSADVRVGTASTRFLPSFVVQGLVPDAGTTYFATRAMGYDAATRWLLGSEEITGRHALDVGLLTDYVEDGDAVQVARDRARALGSLPAAATAHTIALMRRASRSALAEQLDLEAVAVNQVVYDPETIEARTAQAARVGDGGRGNQNA